MTGTKDGPVHFEYTLTRAKLNDLVEDLIARTVKPCRQALKDAKVSESDIKNVILVGGMTRMPAVVKEVKEIFGKDPIKGVNPDEVVAIGAAIQGGILVGDVKGVALLDVTPLSLGIETLGGVKTNLIDRNSTIPVEKTQIFSTAADNQPGVEIVVLQGEREMSIDNKKLGTFQLTGIDPAPRGVPQIEVKFNIDSNGILNVSAKDVKSAKEKSITITDSGNLSKDEIAKAQKEAEEHADADKTRRELIESQNELSNVIYQAEKLKDEEAAKDLSKEDQQNLGQAISEAQQKVSSQKIDEIKSANTKLTKVLSEIQTKLVESINKKAKEESKDDKDDKDSPKKKTTKKTDKAAEAEIVKDKKPKK